MKALHILSAVVLALGLATSAPAAEKKAAVKKESAPPAAEAKKPAAEGKASRSLPMFARVDTIDVSAKSFTMKRKDGVEIKHVLAANASIKNGAADAKFSDIKVGDSVAGLRNKKSETEYEVVKITKFGPAAPRAPKKATATEAAAKAGEAKPATKRE